MAADRHERCLRAASGGLPRQSTLRRASAVQPHTALSAGHTRALARRRADLRVIHTPHTLGMLLKDHGLRVDSCVPHLDDALIVAADQVVLDIAVPAHTAQLGPAGHRQEQSSLLLPDDSKNVQLQGFPLFLGGLTGRAAGSLTGPHCACQDGSTPPGWVSVPCQWARHCQVTQPLPGRDVRHCLHCTVLPVLAAVAAVDSCLQHPVPNRTLLTTWTSRVGRRVPCSAAVPAEVVEPWRPPAT